MNGGWIRGFKYHRQSVLFTYGGTENILQRGVDRVIVMTMAIRSGVVFPKSSSHSLLMFAQSTHLSIRFNFSLYDFFFYLCLRLLAFFCLIYHDQPKPSYI